MRHETQDAKGKKQRKGKKQKAKVGTLPRPRDSCLVSCVSDATGCGF
jgi:hypothetical protein